MPRICFRCRIEKPLLPSIFYRDKARPGGLSYECKECLSARKKGTDRRSASLRSAGLSLEQKAKIRAIRKRYAGTVRGKLIFRLSAYRKIDKSKGLTCTLTIEDVSRLAYSPCVYCGTTKGLNGADRLDNSGPHSPENVVPCCLLCNSARLDNFTPDEMKIIGDAIRQIRFLRGEVPSEGGQ